MVEGVGVAYTQSQRDALANAIALGATVVVGDSGRVEYRSLSEMRSLLAEMDRQLAPSAARPAVTFARFDRGW